MKLLVTLIICPPRTHCQTCRSREGGRTWRATLPGELPDGNVDFECPHGFSFHDDAPPGPVGLPRPADIPGDYDPGAELARMQQGGCCGAPSS